MDEIRSKLEAQSQIRSKINLCVLSVHTNNNDMVFISVFTLFILTNWLGHFKTRSSL